jgi:hypothetical protein
MRRWCAVSFVLEHIANIYTHLAVSLDKQRQPAPNAAAAGSRAAGAGARRERAEPLHALALSSTEEAARPYFLLRQVYDYFLMSYVSLALATPLRRLRAVGTTTYALPRRTRPYCGAQGLKTIARRHMTALVANVKLHLSSSARVRTFAAMLGCAEPPSMGEPTPPPAPAGKFLFYLAWLPAIVGLDRVRFALETEPCPVPVLDLGRAASTLPLSEGIGAKVSAMLEEIISDPLRGFTHRLDLDAFVEFACGLWEREDAVNARTLAAYWARADANGDGVITADEFVALVRAISPTTSDHAAVQLYHATIDESDRLRGGDDADALLLEAFLTVAAAFELRVSASEEADEGGANEADGGVPSAR